MARTVDSETLRPLVQPVVAGLGYELVDLEWKPEAGGWVLRVFIDFPEGAADTAAGGVSLEDCTRVSRALSAELDVADAIPNAYNLEVSSPGLNRPLRAESDFRRFAGKKAKVKTRHPLGDPPGRKNFKGTLKGAEGGQLTIEVDGHDWKIPVADVEKANLEYEFEF